MVTAREAEFAGELLLIQPPRHVDVIAAGAVLVVDRDVFEPRDLAAETRAHGVHDVFAHEPAGVGDAVRMPGRFRVEQNPHGLGRARRQHDDAGLERAFFAGDFVDADDAGRLAVLVHGHLADHGVGQEVEIAGRQRGRQVNRRGLVVGAGGATPAAIGRPETRGARAHRVGEDALGGGILRVEFRRDRVGVLLHAEHGAVNRDDGQAEFLGVFLREEFAGAGLRRREQTAVGRVGRVFETVVGAVNADEHLDLVVVGRDIVVADRPVEPETVARVGFEIVGPVTQGDAAPVVGAAAEHPRAPPPELAGRIARRAGVRLAGHLPTAVDRGVVETKRLVRCARAPERRLGGRLKHRGLFDRIVISPGLEHEHLHALHRERVSGLAAGGAGTDDDHIINRLSLAGGNKGHGKKERQPNRSDKSSALRRSKRDLRDS